MEYAARSWSLAKLKPSVGIGFLEGKKLSARANAIATLVWYFHFGPIVYKDMLS